MLSDARYSASLPCSDLERAKLFYADKLGLTPTDEQPGRVFYEGRGGTASTAGRPELLRPGPRVTTALTTVLSNSTRHGPASGSSGANCKAMSQSCRLARASSICW